MLPTIQNQFTIGLIQTNVQLLPQIEIIQILLVITQFQRETIHAEYVFHKVQLFIIESKHFKGNINL